MAEVRAIGLKSIKIGEIEADGSMSTNLEILGETYQDSAEIVQADSEKTEIYSEEDTEPVEIIEIRGGITVKWSIFNVDPEVLKKVLGGKVTGTAPNKVWEQSENDEKIERSIELITKTNNIVTIPRAIISAKFNWKVSKKGVALIDITGRVLKPKKDGLSAFQVANAE